MRQKLPGSPFQLHVVAANASASGSLITGADAVRNTPLTAGEPLELGLYFRDDFGNACAPPERGSKVAVAAVVEEEESSPSRLGLRRGSTLQGLDSKGLRRGSTTSGGKKESAAAANAVAGSSGKHFEQGVEATPHEEEIITDKLRQETRLGRSPSGMSCRWRVLTRLTSRSAVFRSRARQSNSESSPLSLLTFVDTPSTSRHTVRHWRAVRAYAHCRGQVHEPA